MADLKQRISVQYEKRANIILLDAFNYIDNKNDITFR
jgi:hypothetical protein